MQVRELRKRTRVGERINRTGYFFVLPFILVYACFSLWPVLYTFALSVGNLRGLRSDFDFVGLANFKRLVTDRYFWGAVGNTFIIWGLNFIPQLGIALLFAIWFTDIRLNLRGKNLFRAIFYVPNLLTTASIAILFRSLFSYPIGPVNQFLTQTLGLYTEATLDGEVVRQGFNFFRMPTATRIIVAFIQWWMWCGQTLILLMAGITSISPSLYEAAVVDGANRRQQTLYVTLPLLRPMMLYILVTSAIGGMQMFEIPFLLTGMHGEPDYKIRTMVVYMYNIGFQGGVDYSYAATIAIGIFIITIILSVGINSLTKERQSKKHAA